MIHTLTVLDDIFDNEALLDFLTKSIHYHADGAKWTYMNKSETFTNSLINIASKYYDTSKIVGYETWVHSSTRPEGDEGDGWHYDRDELSYHVRKILRFPIFSAIFYLKVENLVGGRILIGNNKITPKENRLIIFGPGYKHAVEEFSGERISIVINPWNRKLEQYTL